jgi:cyclic pyranopterin phosphate synthase
MRLIRVDPFGRRVSYLRVSVTDRCDLRCVYCMAEDMTFLPKAEVLTPGELDRLCGAFIGLGVDRIRLTGGEPLVRKNVLSLVRSLGSRVGTDLRELTLTTNGTQLAKMAGDLHAAGVRRINVSLDTLDPAAFAAVTRWGKLEQVLDGVFAAKAAGLAIRINAVALKGVNEHEYDRMLAWCGEHGFDLCLIETMPLGDVSGDRTDQYLPLSTVRARLRERWTLRRPTTAAGGPGPLTTRAGEGGASGSSTPMTHNFCEVLNRVAATCTGTLYNVPSARTTRADLRPPLRDPPSERGLRDADPERLPLSRRAGLRDRPSRKAPAVARHMSVTAAERAMLRNAPPR